MEQSQVVDKYRATKPSSLPRSTTRSSKNHYTPSQQLLKTPRIPRLFYPGRASGEHGLYGRLRDIIGAEPQMNVDPDDKLPGMIAGHLVQQVD